MPISRARYHTFSAVDLGFHVDASQTPPMLRSESPQPALWPIPGYNVELFSFRLYFIAHHNATKAPHVHHRVQVDWPCIIITIYFFSYCARKYLAAFTMLVSAAFVSFHCRVLSPQSGSIHNCSGLRYCSISAMRSLISCSLGIRGE